MIDIIQASYGYTTKERIIDKLTLKLEPGHIYGLLGRNGIGKSTLLNLIAGLLFPQEGTIEMDGVPMRERRIDVLARMFYMPDEFSFPNVPLWKYFKDWASFYPSFSEEVCRRCLDEFEMSDLSDLGHLSLGELKKAMIAFALAVRPKLLLMDEPTNGLDIPSKAIFRKMLMREVRDDAAVVISTHQVHDVENLLDYLLILRDDRTLWSMSTQEVMARYRFGSSPTADGALYAEPAPEGFRVVKPNTSGEDCAIDLELLYNAVTKAPSLPLPSEGGE
jgi:ABC-2 type transport system ATP-binding protein